MPRRFTQAVEIYDENVVACFIKFTRRVEVKAGLDEAAFLISKDDGSWHGMI